MCNTWQSEPCAIVLQCMCLEPCPMCLAVCHVNPINPMYVAAWSRAQQALKPCTRCFATGAMCLIKHCTVRTYHVPGSSELCVFVPRHLSLRVPSKFHGLGISVSGGRGMDSSCIKRRGCATYLEAVCKSAVVSSGTDTVLPVLGILQSTSMSHAPTARDLTGTPLPRCPRAFLVRVLLAAVANVVGAQGRDTCISLLFTHSLETLRTLLHVVPRPTTEGGLA